MDRFKGALVTHWVLGGDVTEVCCYLAAANKVIDIVTRSM